jgi:hypothetical protein
MASTEQAIQAQALHQDSLLQKANVVGVAVGYKEQKGQPNGDVSLVVLVEQKKPLAALSAEDLVPPEVEGMRTDVYEVGYLRALNSMNPRQSFRPLIPNGVSVSHYKVTAGTLSTIVHDRVTNDRLLLSNNHVFANSNDADLGDPILQPGAMDGGEVDAATVARLERYVRLRYIGDTDDGQPPVVGSPDNGTTPTPNPTPGRGCNLLSIIATFGNVLGSLLGSDARLKLESSSAQQTPQLVASQLPGGSMFVPTNTVDAAVARPVNPDMFSDDILGIGIVNDTTLPKLGMRVRKFGRTTSYTEGNITLLNATVNVAYSTAKGSKTARFTGQVITEAMSQGGDSGSLIVDVDENKAVGLLFAGSNLATIFTPIELVMNALDIRL